MAAIHGDSRVALGVLLLVALFGAATAYHGCATGNCARDEQILPLPVLTEDFQFEMRNIYTDRQRGARVNIFTKFRYYTTQDFANYTTENGTFDYQDMKKVILPFVPAGGMGIPRDTFWEIVNREMCIAIWKAFPIKGLSVRMEVQGMSSGGIAGHRASTVTLGDIEPWASMTNSFPGCDGMSAGRGNSACVVVPSFGQDANNTAKTEQDSKAKAGQHDRPRKCDFCA